MIKTLKRAIIASALVLGTCAGLMLTQNAEVSAKGEPWSDFKGEWKKINRDQKDAMARRDLANGLPANEAEAVEHLLTVLEDHHWNVRWAAVEKIRDTTDQATIDALLNALAEKKISDGVKENIAFALSYRKTFTAKEWEQLRGVLWNGLEDKKNNVSLGVREIIAQKLAAFPAERPMAPSVNDNEQEKKKVEEHNAKVNAVAQPIMKANVKDLYRVMHFMVDEKRSKHLSKDPDYGKFRWAVIYALERLTSQEFGDNPEAWNIWLTQTHWDKEKNDLKDLTYRWPNVVSETIDNVKIDGGTAVRKKKRRDTNTELIILPPLFHPTSYFDPYMEEFTQDFDVSTFLMPSADKGTPPAKDERGGVRENAYYYPYDKVVAAFEKYRKEKGGNKNLGLLCHGSSATIALEFAKNNPDSCAFIICIGAWTGSSGEGQAIRNIQQSNDRLDLKYYGMINRTTYFGGQYPEPFDDWKRFLGDCGAYRHQFSDPYDTNQFMTWSRANSHSAWMRDHGPSRQPLLDPKYTFEAKAGSIKVPALFIWGVDDPMYIQGTDKALSKAFSSSKVVRMKGTSRLPWSEDPMGFFEEVQTFMDKNKVWDRIGKMNEKRENK
ncbi:MAG: HEAT repeat domain-containing protein [Planctomycetes bacterium]|nr:HEAT repeat domain-containing protein [Planctomycetota bacterium]